jgi:hypothetical protein
MEEIQPGVLHWTAFHTGIGTDVHSYMHTPSGTLIDPMQPPFGLDAVPPPERIVLTNRHHYRQSDRFRAEYGCPVLCHEAGLHEFHGRPPVEGFAFGDELAPGVTALEVGVLTPEETALHLSGEGGGALAFADALVRDPDGDLGFVSDPLLGDDPAAIKHGLRTAFWRLIDENDFEALLLAHGEPLATGGRSALMTFSNRRFASRRADRQARSR